MNEAHDKFLCEHYPILYKQRHHNKRKTCMCWGFECSDGWFKPIQKLSEILEALNHNKYKANPIHATQVKEKFGGLRFYTNHVGTYNTKDGDHITSDVSLAIMNAELECSKTCEICGESGTLRATGWWRTLCDKCAAPQRKD